MNWSHFARIIDAEKEIASKATMLMFKEHRLPQLGGIDWITPELACRKNVDMAARHWVKKRQHAVVDLEVAHYLQIRFNSASEFLQEISRINPSYDAPEKRVLTWLLVDHWRLAGRMQWVQSLRPKNWPADEPPPKGKH
jgi:hypothetical protein